MVICKCKMCGGTLEISEGMTVCECERCGRGACNGSFEMQNVRRYS